MNEFPQLTRGQKIGLVVGAIVLLALITVTLIFLINNPPITAALRDILIIVLAIQIFILDVLTIVLLLQIVKLLRYLIEELVPVVNSLQETVGTVRGTATFVSDSVVTPTIQVASKVAGIRSSIGVAFGGSKPRKAQPKAGPSPAAKDMPSARADSPLDESVSST